MARLRSLLLIAALLLPAGLALGQAAGAGEWLSYRDVYRTMVWFEKYGNAKHFLQSQLQVMAAEKGTSVEGLQLSLTGKSTQLHLPLDGTGRTVFPLLKAAYDDNAALSLNRNLSQYRLVARVSIAPRADGVYELADLRAACEQALGFERYANPARVRGKQCVGVRFAFARNSQGVQLRLRKADGEHSLPVQDGAAFDGDPNDSFKTVTLRFVDAPDKAQLVSQSAPLAIAAVFH